MPLQWLVFKLEAQTKHLVLGFIISITHFKMAGLIELNEDQVRKLAMLIYYQEVEAIQKIKFKSEPDRGKYLGDCRAGYESIVRNLDAGAELDRKYKNDGARAAIAHDIYLYLVKGFNMALQAIRNYYLRLTYINKISDHVQTLTKVLKELNTQKVEDVAKLAKAADFYKKAMSDYTMKFQSSVSRNFSKWIHSSKTKFRDLVQTCKKECGLVGRFEELDDTKKIEVYEKILEKSGRGGVVKGEFTKIAAFAGTAVILFTAGIMVWDIFTAERPVETAARDAAMAAAPVAGAILADVVTAVVEAAFVGVEESVLLMVGIITSFAGAFIVGAAAGLLIDLIFGSGGSAPLSTEKHHCSVVQLPDGQVIARQIVHQDMM